MAGEDEELDARVERLWRALDTRKEGRLDAKGLRRGLESIDHRKCTIIIAEQRANYGIALKNADALLQDVLKAFDENGDGIIQYTGMLRACKTGASRADNTGQNFEHSSSRPRRSYGGSSRASIATATAN